MLLAAQVFAAVVLLLHVYFVLLETVLFRTRGAKVFGVPKDQIEMRAAAMSNQGCYNGFLVAAIALGFFYPDPAVARAFMIYGLVCVVVAGIWGAATVSKKILFVQALPAALALAALFLARAQA
jgi:putative membrane protein